MKTKIRWRFVFDLLLLILFFRPEAWAKDAVPEYRYTVSWDLWDDRNHGDNGWTEMEIRLNGVSVGHFLEGFAKLEELPVHPGEHIRLDMPPMPKDGPCQPGHWPSGFLQRWMEKGALADWYEGGKRFNLHTVTWTDYLKDGNYVQTMDDVTWIVDGEVIGKGDTFLRFIEPWKKQSGLVVQILRPLKWNPQFSVDDGDTMRSLHLLNDRKRIRVFHIGPVK